MNYKSYQNLKNLNTLYNSFEINNKIQVFGEYKQMFKLISLNIERIYKDIKKHPYTFNEEEFLLYTYIRILQTVLHELEHVNQEKKKINNTKTETTQKVTTKNNVQLKFPVKTMIMFFA